MFALDGLSCTLTQAAISQEPGVSPSFTSFIVEHGRKYAKGTREYEMRSSIYQQRLKEVESHNSRASRRWNAAVNHLTDRTDVELAQLRGLRIIQSSSKSLRPVGVVSAHKGAFLSQIRNAVVPDEVSWTNLSSVKADLDQGSCGSCWAIATANMLNANAEIAGRKRTFSPQELVDCTPNPHNCGGSGGCQGATVELGMNWVMAQGLETEEAIPYTATDGTCSKLSSAMLLDGVNKGVEYDQKTLDDMIAVGVHGAKSNSAAVLLGLTAWERLPENEYEPLVRAVAERGPAAVSVAAGGWSSYEAGIFDGCSKDATIDHAVTLVGYGIDRSAKEKYWLIKNSWGRGWGEQGNIRLLREQGNVHCGTDYQPKVGTACDGGPSQVHVCGMCGILYDSVVPHFAKK
jgi:cathepsin L